MYHENYMGSTLLCFIVTLNIQFTLKCSPSFNRTGTSETLNHPYIATFVHPFNHRMMPGKFRDDISNGSGVIMLTDRQTHRQTSLTTIHPHCVGGQHVTFSNYINTWPEGGLTMTATNHNGHNHDDQRHNLVKYVQWCREFGDLLKARRFSRFHCCGRHGIPSRCHGRGISPSEGTNEPISI